MRCSYNIQTLVSNPSSRSKSAYSRKNSNCSNHRNLTIIPRQSFDRGNTSATRPDNVFYLKDDETDNEFIIGDLCPTGYSFDHVPRSGPVRGGGVGLFISFEYIDLFLN